MLPLLKKQTQKPTPTSYILQVASLSLSLSLSLDLMKKSPNCVRVLQLQAIAPKSCKLPLLLIPSKALLTSQCHF